MSSPDSQPEITVFSFFSWFLQELFAGNKLDHVTFLNIVQANRHSAQQTSTNWMVHHVPVGGHIATVECASLMNNNACSFGGLVRKLLGEVWLLDQLDFMSFTNACIFG